jgi:arginyl-tRNA synthetase
MNVLALLKDRFRPALAALVPDPAKVAELLDLIRPAQDPKFGDYQANFAMPLGKQLGKPPRDVAAQLIATTKIDDLCQPSEIAGPGFINLRLRDEWLTDQLNHAVHDDRLGIPPVENPHTIVVDYSSPNVAKPMHVGHIRSTVIGDSLTRTLRFLGHRVISDNHIGDWGTQFGMIIYGYRHFVDRSAYAANPVAELARLYKLVHRLVDYGEAVKGLSAQKQRLIERLAEVERLKVQPKTGDKAADKKTAQALSKARDSANTVSDEISAIESKIASVESDPQLSKLAASHATIDDAVLQETAKLHADDAENLKLWHEFLPHCRDEIARVYRRLNVTFDYEYGESFYHDRLAAIVEDLRKKGLAEDSQGAVVVFVESFETPMIVQKKDGAFLYSTSDLATIQFRDETWHPNTILYVVDHRQSEHFDKLFAAARRWGYKNTEFQHTKFGTVMGSDGKPFKTREGTAAGLESLLDEAVTRAAAVVAENDTDNHLSADRRREIAEVVGIGALKYADLSQNRTSDYTFSYDKMLLMNGNTATYMQYSYARVRSIFAKGNFDPEGVRSSGAKIILTQPAERALGLQILRFAEVLSQVEAESMPHYLTGYLFDLAKAYSTFFENCPVLRAETDEVKTSRLLLCDLTARTIRLGLDLLGIQVVERM